MNQWEQALTDLEHEYFKPSFMMTLLGAYAEGGFRAAASYAGAVLLDRIADAVAWLILLLRRRA